MTDLYGTMEEGLLAADLEREQERDRNECTHRVVVWSAIGCNVFLLLALVALVIYGVWRMATTQ